MESLKHNFKHAGIENELNLKNLIHFDTNKLSSVIQPKFLNLRYYQYL